LADIRASREKLACSMVVHVLTGIIAPVARSTPQ
jgi:hypothetical protein